MSDDRERRKKSWKEIDRMRDGSSGGRDDREFQGRKARGGRSQQSYRAALDRAFENGKIGDLVAAQAPTGVAAQMEGGKNKLKMLAAIRDAVGRDEVTAAVDKLLKGSELPDDIDILGRVLEHRDPGLQLQAMERILALLETRKPKRTGAMVGQLKMIRDLGDDPEMVELARELIEKL